MPAPGLNGLITVNRGIVEYAANEEEVCLVIAHEMGHQAANHLATSQRNQAVGALIGAILLGAAGAAASYGSYGSADVVRSAMKSGANIGGAIGGISFSKEQEREADYSWPALTRTAPAVDLDKARRFPGDDGICVGPAGMRGIAVDTHGPARPTRSGHCGFARTRSGRGNPRSSRRTAARRRGGRH